MEWVETYVERREAHRSVPWEAHRAAMRRSFRLLVLRRGSSADLVASLRRSWRGGRSGCAAGERGEGRGTYYFASTSDADAMASASVVKSFMVSMV